MPKEIKKFEDKDLDRILSSLNMGRGVSWMRYTIRDLVLYIKWLNGQDIK